MILEVSKSFEHKSCVKEPRKHSEEELKNALIQLMQENGISEDQFNVTKDGVIELSEQAGLNLHCITLQAEELGFSLRFTKKTLIELW